MASLLVSAALIGFPMARDYWSDRITPGWEWKSSFVGLSTHPTEYGRFPQQDTTWI